MKNLVASFKIGSLENESHNGPFWIMVRKEIGGHIRSWRFIILLILIALTFWGAMYVSMNNIKAAVANIYDPDQMFFISQTANDNGGYVTSVSCVPQFFRTITRN